jgi:hypothetical protein
LITKGKGKVRGIISFVLSLLIVICSIPITHQGVSAEENPGLVKKFDFGVKSNKLKAGGPPLLNLLYGLFFFAVQCD